MSPSTRTATPDNFFARPILARAPMLLILGLLVCTQSGCQIFQRFHGKQEMAPIIFTEPPSQSDLLAKLNSDSARIRQLKTNVSVTMAGLPTSLKGNLIVERPNRLRLKAGVLGVEELGVDVGSNDQSFWIFSKASIGGQQPALLFANHADYQRSAIKASIPLEPSMLIEALGLIEFQPTDVHQGPFQKDGRFVIHTYRNKPTGQEIRETIVDPRGWIVQQTLYKNGKPVAYANSTKHKYYQDPGVYLPQQIQLFVFPPDGSKQQLTVTAGDYSINALYGNPDIMWTMPNPTDVPRIDITRTPLNTSNGQVSQLPASQSLPPPGRQTQPTRPFWRRR